MIYLTFIYLIKIWLSVRRHPLVNLNTLNTWISLRRKEIFKKGKRCFTSHTNHLFGLKWLKSEYHFTCRKLSEERVLTGVFTSSFQPSLGCQEAVGMETGALPDWQISASSFFSANHLASQGRLNFVPDGDKAGGWSAAINDANQWLQVDLVTIFGKLIGVATQGSSDGDQWVAIYSLQYGNDGENFEYYKENGQEVNKVR